MRTSVERFRFGLLVGAGLLVLVIALFLGYARYRLHRAVANLPARLGATITKEFNGYTYSQSDGKRTVFTIHAAKATQHTDGMYTLRDVNMVLYGHSGDRADRISGDEFEYDTHAEVIRAIGIVHLDLDAPAPQGAPDSDARKHLAGVSAAGATPEDAGPNNRVIHVKTSGLVYMKKLGIAATGEGIEFAFGGFTGHAVGAEYSSGTGHVVLQSAITVSGLDHGRPVALSASHGELDRATSLAAFNSPHYSSGGQAAQAEFARLHLRSDGNVERIEGERQVQLVDAGQGTVFSDRADVALSVLSKPATALLTGNVRFTSDEPLRQAHGECSRANLNFDDQGHVDHTLLEGGVRTFERLHAAGNANDLWSERTLWAESLDLALKAGEGGVKPVLSDVKARGSARLVSMVPASSGPGSDVKQVTTTKLSADLLAAHLVPHHGNAELSTVHGVGHTRVEQINATGVDQSSSGDTLDAEYRPGSAAGGAVELATAVQQGSVSMDRTSALKKAAGTGAAPDVQHATARMAAYDAASDRLTLTGDVEMNDSGSVLRAARVAVAEDSGDATAEGAVKVTYVQAGSAQPVHILAARAELEHDAGRATFYAKPLTAGTISGVDAGLALARLWQAGEGGRGGSQVEAPVLVLEQEQRRFIARSERPGVRGQVHATLADDKSAKSPLTNGTDPAGPRSLNGVAHITSTQMVYYDLNRQAEFMGGVRVVDAAGELQATAATVFLTPAPTANDKTAPAQSAVPMAATPASGLTGLLGGSVERIVATQHIEITQPGRRATGERLVYTASDQMFVLTGTAATPPKVVDTQQGTTTGASLRFHSGDDSVVISGRDGDAPVQKVHTETRVKQ